MALINMFIVLFPCFFALSFSHDSCMQIKEVGPCKGHFPRWYHDVEQNMCLQFIFGGCGGNRNNFERFEDCNRLCESKLKGLNMTLVDDLEHITGSVKARERTSDWLRVQVRNISGTNQRAMSVSRIAVALYLADPKFFKRNDIIADELAYEVDNQILVRMLSSPDGATSAVFIKELPLYIHALLVTCSNPRDFHGLNLVEKLRRHVDKGEPYVSPFALLSLCNANDEMTAKDIDKLIYAFELKGRTSWTGVQALALMALSCIADRPAGGPNVNPSIIADMSATLKGRQNGDGSFENLYTTALVIQALFPSDTEDEGGWNMTQAVKFLINNQKDDGSYGNILNAYSVLPVLHHNSLINISRAYCPAKTLDDSIENIHFKNGRWLEVVYRVWIGDKPDLAYFLILPLMENMTVFDVLKIAKVLDKKYDFKYDLVDSKPYIYWLAGYQDDPENEIFWGLDAANTAGFDTAQINSSPMDIIRDGSETAAVTMWYRRRRWMRK